MAKGFNYKLYTSLVLVTSLFGYLEWGTDQSQFIWEIEWMLLSELPGSLQNFAHPLIVIPLIGQLLLIFSLIQKTRKKWVDIFSVSTTSILFLMFVVAGSASQNWKIILSTLPFFIADYLFLRSGAKLNRHLINRIQEDSHSS